MRSSSNPGIQPGEPDRSQTGDPQCDPGHCPPVLYVVGIGPGSMDLLSGRAMDVLAAVDTVAGYTTYIDLIRPLLEGKKIICTAMRKEVERVEAAIEAALDGRRCAIVSSGDPGIYAMAGLVFEMCREKGITAVPPATPPQRPGDSPGADAGGKLLAVEVVPGIPALCAGAALLGAPLTHDFAVISLSDLLTPWETITSRLEAAARADFVIVLYNPKSKKRNWQLTRAQEIVLGHRHPDTPTGIVTGAARPHQRVSVIPLKDLDQAKVDMQTIVFIGSSASVSYLDFMVTPRGYARKYALDTSGPAPGERSGQVHLAGDSGD